MFADAVRVTLLLERADADEVRRFAAWRSSTEGRNLSQGSVLLEALRNDRRFKAWKLSSDVPGRPT